MVATHYRVQAMHNYICSFVTTYIHAVCRTSPILCDYTYVDAELLIKLLECDFWVNINHTCCVYVQSETDTRQPQVAMPTFGVPIPETGSSTKGFIQVVATM